MRKQCIPGLPLTIEGLGTRLWAEESSVSYLGRIEQMEVSSGREGYMIEKVAQYHLQVLGVTFTTRRLYDSPGTFRTRYTDRNTEPVGRQTNG